MMGFVLYLAATFAALATLIIEYLREAIASGGFVVVAFGLIAAAWLMWSRRGLWLRRVQVDEDRIEFERGRGKSLTIAIMGCIGLAAAVFAQLIHSPFLGWLTFLFLLGVIAYAEFSVQGLRSCLPVLILLGFIKPIPAILEPWVQLGFQSASTSLTMMMLDLLKIFFYTEGNTIGLVSQQSLATPLFEGVEWLYLAVLIAIAWSVHFQYHGVRTFLNVCQAIFWVLLWNAFGDAILLANKEWGGAWMDSTPVVGAWSLVGLALILFFMWSSDQFLSSMVRPKENDGGIGLSDATQRAALMNPEWKLHGFDWGILAGLVAVCLLSLRIASHEGWGWETAPNQVASLTLSPDLDSWKVQEEEPSEYRGYDRSTRTVRTWSLENEGKKLTLQVAGPGSADLPYLYRWRWDGWRLDGDAKPSIEIDTADGSVLAHVVRLPGETCGVIILGADRYGSWLPANPAVDRWSQFTALAWGNLQRAIGSTPAAPGPDSFSLPAGHSVSLAWKGVKTLDKEKSGELRSVWKKILPLVEQQIGNSHSK